MSEWVSFVYPLSSGWLRTMCMICPGGKSGVCVVRAIMESVGWTWYMRHSFSFFISSSSSMPGSCGSSGPQSQHISEPKMIFHWNRQNKKIIFPACPAHAGPPAHSHSTSVSQRWSSTETGKTKRLYSQHARLMRVLRPTVTAHQWAKDDLPLKQAKQKDYIPSMPGSCGSSGPQSQHISEPKMIFHWNRQNRKIIFPACPAHVGPPAHSHSTSVSQRWSSIETGKTERLYSQHARLMWVLRPTVTAHQWAKDDLPLKQAKQKDYLPSMPGSCGSSGPQSQHISEPKMIYHVTWHTPRLKIAHHFTYKSKHVLLSY